MLDADSIRPRGTGEPAELTPTQLGWLIRLRWLALLGIGAAAGLAASGAFPGVHWPVIAVIAVLATAYNALVARAHRRGANLFGSRAALGQALVDFGLLTLVLWAAGGVRTPFLSFYVLHVALVGILSGPRATVRAAAVALGCAALLALPEFVPPLQLGTWRPVRPWDVITDVVAFTCTLGAAAYLVITAVRELGDRERALARARDRSALEYELLSTTLNELDAGLEVLDGERKVVWRNRRAQQLSEVGEERRWECPASIRSCQREPAHRCPVHGAFEQGEASRCRFALDVEGTERLYELLSFPLSVPGEDPPRVMNLYVDRTTAMMAERRLVLAERLASLGRVAQGVAHELNTPLSTIQTLAADMTTALSGLALAPPNGPGSQPAEQELLDDVQQSARLIKDETRRLGRITQSLLAGGDLVRSRVDGAVPLRAVVERAGALVFAGVKDGPEVQVDTRVGSLRVAADPDRLVQVLVNLLQNAHDAVQGQAEPRVRVLAQVVTIPTRPALGGAELPDQGHVRPDEAGLAGSAAGPHYELVELRVQDNGPGLAREVADRLFEPFCTTKPPGQGTGLGLYTSYMLVQAMGGTLLLDSLQGGGCRATVRLPMSTTSVPLTLVRAPRAGSTIQAARLDSPEEQA